LPDGQHQSAAASTAGAAEGEGATMGVEQLPDGRWRIDYRDQFGKRYRKTYTKERAAQRALHDAERAVEQGAHVAPTHLPTFAEMAEQ
jgi:hypothetical protein